MCTQVVSRHFAVENENVTIIVVSFMITAVVLSAALWRMTVNVGVATLNKINNTATNIFGGTP